ncbi:MAG: SGNH/GDSL hydrolase family protein [Clostridiales bacterium]|nr:SGNH/GDSL hydrolase family protein [Clostridiales bacterium]
MLFRKNAVIVFQGDSVTDAGRTRPDSHGFGQGYPAMCAGMLRSLYPDYELTIYNRGIGGNRVEHLVERWQQDTLELRPNVVSILIGINNVWHPYANPEIPYDIVKFEGDLARIVEQTVHYGSKLVMLEPFAFHHGCFPEEWRVRLWEVNQVVRRIALRYADAFIPLDGIFYQAAVCSSPASLTADGVHPTFEGHRLIAQEWMKAVAS